MAQFVSSLTTRETGQVTKRTGHSCRYSVVHMRWDRVVGQKNEFEGSDVRSRSDAGYDTQILPKFCERSSVRSVHLENVKWWFAVASHGEPEVNRQSRLDVGSAGCAIPTRDFVWV